MLLPPPISATARRFTSTTNLTRMAHAVFITVPPGKKPTRYAQIQRLTIEQYRLLILFRLPQAKAKRQSLAQLQIQYDNVSSILRKSRASNTDYRNQQEMLTQVADLEPAVADVVAKTRCSRSAQAYQQIIELKFTEAQLKRVSYSARFSRSS